MAESVYRWIFNHEAGEAENCRFLAHMYEEVKGRPPFIVES